MSNELSLRKRYTALTLPDRSVSPGSSALDYSRYIVLQGFSYSSTFTAKAFLLYGLASDAATAGSGSSLTLYRRVTGSALTLPERISTPGVWVPPVGGGENQLDFSDADNSQYVVVL